MEMCHISGHGNIRDIYAMRMDVEIFLDMPVISTDFENLVCPNNKICKCCQ